MKFMKKSKQILVEYMPKILMYYGLFSILKDLIDLLN